MLEDDVLQSRLPSQMSSSGDSGVCMFRPDSYVANGVRVERQQFPAGPVECAVLPFLVVGVQDGPAVMVTQKLSGRMHSRVAMLGDVEIYPAGFSDGAVTLDRSSEQIYVGVEPNVISKISEAAGIDPNRSVILAHFGSQDNTIYHVARRLLREQQTSGLGGGLYTEALVTELVIHLLREYSTLGRRANESSRNLDPGQLRPALEMIHDDLQANPSLRALADAVQLSHHHFSRVFKRLTGLAPHQYLISQRIKHARRLLIETSLSIAEVAQQVGFYDQSHFNYHFKRLVGVTPREVLRRKNVLPE
jgi:AraC family transcriptional regulator